MVLSLLGFDKTSNYGKTGNYTVGKIYQAFGVQTNAIQSKREISKTLYQSKNYRIK
jgi:hypothetical protein